jgi:hypothetical protein
MLEFQQQKQRLAAELERTLTGEKISAKTAYAEATGEEPPEGAGLEELYVGAGKATGQRRLETSRKEDLREKAKIVREITSAGGEAPANWRDMDLAELQIMAGEVEYDLSKREEQQKYYQDIDKLIVEKTGQGLEPFEEYKSPEEIRKDALEKIKKYSEKVKPTIETNLELAEKYGMGEPEKARLRAGHDFQDVLNDFQQDQPTAYEHELTMLQRAEAEAEDLEEWLIENVTESDEVLQPKRERLEALKEEIKARSERLKSLTRRSPTTPRKNPQTQRYSPQELDQALDQARQELGPDASAEDVRLRAKEILMGR